MIYYGRILYLKDIWLTKTSDAIKIGYSEEKLKWVQDNENQIWRNFIENEYLFSTNPKLIARFISLAPFSKFYLEFDIRLLICTLLFIVQWKSNHCLRFF